MSAIDNSPCDQDLLQSAKFLFSIPRLTTTQFFCQAANIPGITTQSKLQHTPTLGLKIPGDKINFEPLIIEFLIDEKLASYLAISDWMRGIAFPEDSEQYVNLKHLSRYSEQVKFPQYADSELIVLSASNQQLIKVQFKDMFPVGLSGIQFDIRISSEKTMTAIATFEYKRFDIYSV